jgi:hypothetical protein
VSDAGYTPWSGGTNPMMKWGGLGAVATMIILPVLFLTGVPPGLERWVVAAWMAAMLYFSLLFFVGMFRQFDRGAYPIIVGVAVIPLVTILVMVAAGIL